MEGPLFVRAKRIFANAAVSQNVLGELGVAQEALVTIRKKPSIIHEDVGVAACCETYQAFFSLSVFAFRGEAIERFRI